MTDGGFDTAKHERLRDPERLRMLRIPEVISRVIDADTRHVIDIGAGTGVWSEAFLKAGVLNVTAVDSSSTMIEQIQRLVPEARRMQTQAQNIPMADESADLVFAAFVLHEIEDKVGALNEWKRLSRRTIAVMDWPYRDEDIGPPTSRRMKKEEVCDYGRQAGLGEPDVWETDDWLLYIWRERHLEDR